MKKTALVLAGGGARGAWQAGVLAWIGQALPAATGSPLRFDQMVGSSVGALNAAFLAGAAEDLGAGTQALWDHWAGTEVGSVYRMRLRRLWRVPRALLQGGEAPRGPIALLDSGPLHRVVRERVDWRGLKRALWSGALGSLALVATDLASGEATVFHQEGAGRGQPVPGRGRSFVPADLAPEHVFASVALPLLFPPVALGRHWYLDGGLSEQTPVGSALGLGARRILSLSLQAPATDATDHGWPPTWPRVIGKTMTAVLSDRSEPALERMERVNRLVRWGEGAYGPGFAERLAEGMGGGEDGPWEPTEALALHPSRDLGELASEQLAAGLQGRVDDMTRVVFRFLQDTAGAGDADALSYLLFDPGYLHALLKLGWSDAEAQGEAILAFLGDAE